jgi:hypothetical protein
MTYARRVDGNQKDIVKSLRSSGVSVQTGYDDILVGHAGRTFWFEIKNAETLDSSGNIKNSSIRPGQKELRENWGGQYDIIHSYEEIMDIITEHVR